MLASVWKSAITSASIVCSWPISPLLVPVPWMVWIGVEGPKQALAVSKDQT